MEAVINGSNASFTVNNTVDGAVISTIYPLAKTTGLTVFSTTGEKALSLTVDGYTVISLANTPGAVGFGNSIFGATDIDVATAAVKTALGSVGGSGGGGGVATSPADIASGINQATDVDTIVTRLTSIATNNIRTIATPIAQTTLTIAAGETASFVIPVNCRCLTICVTSGSIVHYTEDGSKPTANNCWFGYGSKEIWETNIPTGATLRFLATSASVITLQPRI